MAENMLAAQIQPAPSIGPVVGQLNQLRLQQQQLSQQNALYGAMAGGDPNEIAKYDPDAATSRLKFNSASRADAAAVQYAAAAANGDKAAMAALIAAGSPLGELISGVQQHQQAILSAMSEDERKNIAQFGPAVGAQLATAYAEPDPAKKAAILATARPNALKAGWDEKEIDDFIAKALSPDGNEVLGATGYGMLATGKAAQDALTAGHFSPTDLSKPQFFPQTQVSAMGAGAAAIPGAKPAGTGIVAGGDSPTAGGHWATPEEKAAGNFKPDASLWIDKDGTPKVIGASGVTVNNDSGTPTKGYRFVRDDQGRIISEEPIPGSPEEAAAKAAAAKTDANAGAKVRIANTVIDSLDRTIDSIETNPAGTAGWGGAFLRFLPQSQAQSVQERLRTITANLGFDKLQEMRAASPTGGALGQVSDFENRLLQAVAGSLEQSQDPTELLYNLKRIRMMYSAVIGDSGDLSKKVAAIGKAVDSGVLTQKEGQERIDATLSASKAPPDIDKLLEKYAP